VYEWTPLSEGRYKETYHVNNRPEWNISRKAGDGMRRTSVLQYINILLNPVLYQCFKFKQAYLNNMKILCSFVSICLLTLIHSSS
jgi:hypothetical protein